MNAPTPTSSVLYTEGMIDVFENFTPRSLPSNEKQWHNASISHIPHSFNDLTFYELYTKPLCGIDGITLGRYAGAFSLLWYNTWDDIMSTLKGHKNPVSLRLFLPDYFMKYIQDVIQKGHISEQNLRVALIYALRFRMKSNIGVFSQHTSLARIFITSLLLANKMEDDISYSTKSWAGISNIDNNELKQMEIEFLKVIDFNLHVNVETWNEYNTFFFEQFVFPMVDQMVNRRKL